MPDEAPNFAPESVRRRMARGFGWMVAARWCIRSIGLVSTVILARLLAPTDFGLVAMGTVALALVRVFADSGQVLAIIRHPDPTPEHFDTAWTMSVCGGLLIALALFATAPLAAWYFHDPRVVILLRFLALAPLIEGFTNIGAAAGFRRDLSFDKDFRFLVTKKFGGFVIAVPAALLLQDYRALVLGIVGGSVFSVLVSYRMHPYRPRLRLNKYRELWSFSVWSQLGNIALYFGDQTDQLVLGALAGAAPMGVYNVGRDLATSPTNEVVIPAARSLFPVYARLLGDPANLARAYLDVLSLVAVISLSMGVGVALVAHGLVLVVLGGKWLAAARLIPWLAIAGGVLGVSRSVNAVVNATGNARLRALRNWAFVAFFLPATTLCGLRWGSEGVAVARLAVTLLFVPVMFYTLMRVIPVSAGEIAARLWRPTLAAAAMAAVLFFADAEKIPSMLLRLMYKVGVGAAVFSVSLLALWWIAGRPSGAERLLLSQASDTIRRIAAAIGRHAGIIGGKTARADSGQLRTRSELDV
jgi:lipopolysaccharide exporter